VTRGGKRRGAGSGGPRPGAGRPKTRGPRFINGETLVFEREELGGTIHPPRLARVIGVGDNELELQIDNEIIVIRRELPDEENEAETDE
jgi:hypothetical protein